MVITGQSAVGYFLSGIRPISPPQGRPRIIRRMERDELLEDIIQEYIETI
jgi:uncharacterized protein (UPF0297 family)